MLMKNLIKLEEFALFIFAIYLFTLLDFSWWIFPLLLLTPDLGAIGYIGGPRVGAAPMVDEAEVRVHAAAPTF